MNDTDAHHLTNDVQLQVFLIYKARTPLQNYTVRPSAVIKENSCVWFIYWNIVFYTTIACI